MKRRTIIAGMGALFASGCSKVADSTVGSALFSAAEDWHRKAHRSLSSRTALVREYARSDISPVFRGNGSVTVDTDEYRRHAAQGFANWRLAVGGMVASPQSLSLENLRAFPQRTQITRHDCVEGWSAIGEWTGPQLATVLAAAGISEQARFIVFRCADVVSGRAYYESVDMIDAMHPQTIIAHQLNGGSLSIKNGAPLRMRIERQLGYKHAKYLTAIDAAASLDDVGLGKGGYWEDHHGYQWYAGI